MNARKLLSAAKAVEAAYIEDVFSTYLYTGNGSTQTITNGIDLSGKGGLVWIKMRSVAGYEHILTDTARGAQLFLSSDNTLAQQTGTNDLTAFTSTGFSLGSSSRVNRSVVSENQFVSWTFRKQAKFFDVVTYTGDGANRTIAHNLGSVPGCIIVKRTDTTADWQVYHRSIANTEYLVLNDTAAKATGATRWNSTTPTSTVFSLGTDTTVNASGGTYVAYLFAHDAGGFGASGSDNVISCGSFTTDGSGKATVTLGYEPQWYLQKITGVGTWWMTDTMRGYNNSQTFLLQPNSSNAEYSDGNNYMTPTATGFTVQNWNASTTYIYIAIRRGPMKTPTTGTSVFVPVTQTLATGSFVNTGFVTDMGLSKALSTADPILESRLTKAYLRTNTTGAESSGSSTWDYMNGYGPTPWSGAGLSSVAYGFRRAPGFFDVVCYTGTGANTTVTHNLGVAPELWIVKGRSGATAWAAGSTSLANTEYLVLNTTAAKATGATYWNSTFPTASNLSLGTAGDVNTSSATYVAYLFATVAGVSKVFSYTGNGSSQTINCGFTGGARFVLIKRTDSTGDWYVWDSARGIVAGNDPHLSLNSTAAEVTTDDSVDTDSTGFVVNQLAATNVNVNAATYIGLAIA